MELARVQCPVALARGFLLPRFLERGAGRVFQMIWMRGFQRLLCMEGVIQAGLLQDQVFKKSFIFGLLCKILFWG